MTSTLLSRFLLTFACLYTCGACSTSPMGRGQLILVPEGQMSQMGEQAFNQLKTSEKIDTDPTVSQYVKCIVEPLIQATRDQTPNQTGPNPTGIDAWEVVVFNSKQVNAFALPGRKIGVYTGMIRVAQNSAQLAAVLAHEIGHVIARHGAERVSQQAGTQLGLAALSALAGHHPNKNAIMGLLGMGAQVGLTLPFSRTQESEADQIGLQLMAKAGFDPKQNVELWKNMVLNEGGQAPPQILSDHPASQNRITDLEAHMTQANTLYQTAKGQGKNPICAIAQSVH